MKKLSVLIIVCCLFFSTTSAVALQNHLPIDNNNGETISQSSFDDIIPSIIEQIDETMMATYIMDLVDFGPHPTMSPECDQAAEYLFDQFESMGLETLYHNWYYDSNNYGKNIEAILPGISEEVYTISAHYDTWHNSPGADDDSAGVAAVLTAAYVLRQYSFNHTIRFVLFSGEEQRLYGSCFYAQDAYYNCDNIIANINLDMMGYASNPEEESKIRIYRNPSSSWIVDEYTIPISQKYSDLIDFEVLVYDDPTGHGSDYLSFWDFGYDALFYHEYKWNPYIHTPEDTIENMNIHYAKKIARFAIATLAVLASSPILDNSEPEVPATPSGPANGKILVEYTYTASTTDPDGDNIYYIFDWDDGTHTGWLGPYNSGETVEASHRWTEKGTYSVKVKSKDAHGIQSDWSNACTTSMPRNVLFENLFFLKILQKVIDLFLLFKNVS